MEQIKVIKSNTEPNNKNVLWLSREGLKEFKGNGWEVISGDSGGQVDDKLFIKINAEEISDNNGETIQITEESFAQYFGCTFEEYFAKRNNLLNVYLNFYSLYNGELYTDNFIPCELINRYNIPVSGGFNKMDSYKFSLWGQNGNPEEDQYGTIFSVVVSANTDDSFKEASIKIKAKQKAGS